MIITAIDLTLTSTGFAAASGSGVLVPPKALGLGMERNNWIMRKVLELGAGVDVLVIEGYSFGSNSKGTIDRAQLGGIVRWALWSKGIPYVEVPPTSLKMFATGTGKGKKDGIFAEAIRRLGYMGTSHDEADALWLRAMAYAAYGAPIVQIPQGHKRGLDKINWHSPIRRAAA